jgi:hypothetical protein
MNIGLQSFIVNIGLQCHFEYWFAECHSEQSHSACAIQLCVNQKSVVFSIALLNVIPQCVSRSIALLSGIPLNAMSFHCAECH